jgi:hydroxypyruvate isomerase
MKLSQSLSRRGALKAGVLTSGSLILAEAGHSTDTQTAPVPLKGKVHHSVSRWCFGSLSLEELCQQAKEIGIESIELLGEKDWQTIKQYGLTCAMPIGPGGIGDGWNHVENHDKLVAESERLLPLIKEAGFQNMIVMSGNRCGMSDEEGIKNCVNGLKRIISLAEKLNITLCMELLNSRDHKDYHCDHTAWGVEVAKQVGSERMKLLYDIYHMQIMEGNVVQTIRDNIQYIGHFHTGGVPGRGEIDETQELYYPFIIKAILETGYKGFIGQEFVPKRDPIPSLRQAIRICDV